MGEVRMRRPLTTQSSMKFEVQSSRGRVRWKDVVGNFACRNRIDPAMVPGWHDLAGERSIQSCSHSLSTSDRWVPECCRGEQRSGRRRCVWLEHGDDQGAREHRDAGDERRYGDPSNDLRYFLQPRKQLPPKLSPHVRDVRARSVRVAGAGARQLLCNALRPDDVWSGRL